MVDDLSVAGRPDRRVDHHRLGRRSLLGSYAPGGRDSGPADEGSLAPTLKLLERTHGREAGGSIGLEPALLVSRLAPLGREQPESVVK